jgi:uncharacterized protein YecT (DUF1311 family)
MKTYCFVLIFILTVAFTAKCEAQEKTQSQLTDEYSKIVIRSKGEMENVYNKILKLYSSDTLFMKNFRRSQHAWIEFFSAEEKAMFPDCPAGNYGSMYSMCVSQFADRLIKSRMRELEGWLIGREDGDCLSSVKNKSELPPYSPK